MEGVNGLSMEDLQRRANALVDRTQDPKEWRYRSADGFLGEGENLKDVIDADLSSMKELNITKEQLAELLKQAILQADDVIQERFNLPFPMTYSGQNLEVFKNWFMSPQYSLFYNENRENSQFNESWQCEYTFRNMDNNIFIKVGGDSKCGVVHYIEWLGFCEGGHPSNEYRVDPHLVVAALTGKIMDKTVQIMKEKLAFACENLQREINYCEKFIVDIISQGDKETTPQRREELDHELEFLRGEVKKKVAALQKRKNADERYLATLSLNV